jgi:hypothetical protein
MLDRPQPSPAEIATNDIDTLRRQYPEYGRETALHIISGAVATALLPLCTKRGTLRAGCETRALAVAADIVCPLVPEGTLRWLMPPTPRESARRYASAMVIRAEARCAWAGGLRITPPHEDTRPAEQETDRGGAVMTCTLSIYDVHPAQSSGGGAWPTHDDVEMRATTLADALDEARETLESAAGDCRPEDGYEVGQWIYAQIEAPDGTGDVVGYELTAEDLGVEVRS